MKNSKQDVSDNKFSVFMSDLLLMPIWIKQLLYVYLRYRLEEELTPQYLDSYELDDIFQLHKSVLTYKGKKELETKYLNLQPVYYFFLQDSLDGLTIAELAVKNNLNLFEISNVFIDCLEKEFIAKPTSDKMIEIVRYMAGKTRIGEYFLRIGLINSEQLEQVLDQQAKIKQATNEQVGTATVLVNMGFVPESEIKAILRYKEESRKRFTLDNFIQTDVGVEEDPTSLKITNERLLKENKILKLQLRKLLNLSE